MALPLRRGGGRDRGPRHHGVAGLGGRRDQDGAARAVRPAERHGLHLRARGHDPLRRAGAAAARHRRDEHLRLDGAEHEVRGRRVRPLPVRPVLRVQGRAGVPLRPDRSASSACGRCEVAAAKPKLAVFKFASCDGCQLSAPRLRGRAAGGRGRDRDRELPRGLARGGEGPLRRDTGRGLDHHAARRRAHPGRAQAVAASWSRSGPAPPPAASRRCATSRTCASSRAPSTRRRSTSARSRPRRPISQHVRGGLRAARLPDQQAPAASRCWGRSCSAGGRTSPPTRCASSASGAAPCA